LWANICAFIFFESEAAYGHTAVCLDLVAMTALGHGADGWSRLALGEQRTPACTLATNEGFFFFFFAFVIRLAQEQSSFRESPLASGEPSKARPARYGV
jgi:hypothetical protein